MANPIERNLVSASELIAESKRPRVTVIDPLTDYIPLDAEAVVAIMKAHHTASSLLGMLESRRRYKGKKNRCGALPWASCDTWRHSPATSMRPIGITRGSSHDERRPQQRR
jgi:hypothetical protein